MRFIQYSRNTFAIFLMLCTMPMFSQPNLASSETAKAEDSTVI